MTDTKTVLERGIELWNAHDREGWAGLFDERAELEAPGGLRLSGRAGAEQFYDAWNEAFPDNAIVDQLVFGAGSQGARRRNSVEPTPVSCDLPPVTSRPPARRSSHAMRRSRGWKTARSSPFTCTSTSPTSWANYGRQAATAWRAARAAAHEAAAGGRRSAGVASASGAQRLAPGLSPTWRGLCDPCDRSSRHFDALVARAQQRTEVCLSQRHRSGGRSDHIGPGRAVGWWW